MRFIHCTKKLLKELKANPHPAPDLKRVKGLGNWYANLLRFNRRKCILFTHERSIYSFLVPNVVQKNLKRLSVEFIEHLSRNLQYEEVSKGVIDRLKEEYREVSYAPTSSRRVLGFMTDFALHYEFMIQQSGGTEAMPLLEINSKINRTPCNAGTKHCFYPIDAMREIIVSEYCS